MEPRVEKMRESNSVGVREKPPESVATRLCWLRSQLGKVLSNLEDVDNSLLLHNEEQTPSEPKDHARDVLSVVEDLEKLANLLGEVTARVSERVGQVEGQ
jgi:hypothetical protein